MFEQGREAASLYRSFGLLDCALVGATSGDDGLHDREQVLGAVLQFTSQQFLALLGAVLLDVGAHTLHGEPELPGNRNGKIDLRVSEDVRRLVVGHELADEFALFHQRNESESADIFCFHGCL